MADCSQTLLVDSDEDEEEIDPRIQVELDNLNGASEIINHLEILHADATTRFRSMNDAAINELKRFRKTLGKNVDKSRPYYEARKQARQIQSRTQNAARAYQRAMSLYEAAKETIALAEERLTAKDQHEIDPAWQEMLNHAIIKVYDAEKEKSRTENEHRSLAIRLAASEREASQLAQKFTSSINKARPYFERRSYLEESLEEQKQKIADLSSSIQSAKQNYRASLDNLETISEEIHHIRKQKRLPPREPGVGAENDEILAENQLEINIDTLDTLSITSSQTGNSEVVCDESETMHELRKTLERCHSNEPSRHGNEDCRHSDERLSCNIPADIVIVRRCHSDEAERGVRPLSNEGRHGDETGRGVRPLSNEGRHSDDEVQLLAEATLPSDAAVLETNSTTYLPTPLPTSPSKSPLSPSTIFSVENQFFSTNNN